MTDGDKKNLDNQEGTPTPEGTPSPNNNSNPDVTTTPEPPKVEPEKEVKLDINYAQLIKDSETKIKEQQEKAKREQEAINNNTINKEMLESIMQQTQAQMNQVIAENTAKIKSEYEDKLSKITNTKGKVNMTNPNSEGDKTPKELALEEWNNKTPEEKAHFMMNMKQRMVVQYDVNPYGKLDVNPYDEIQKKINRTK